MSDGQTLDAWFDRTTVRDALARMLREEFRAAGREVPDALEERLLQRLDHAVSRDLASLEDRLRGRIRDAVAEELQAAAREEAARAAAQARAEAVGEEEVQRFSLSVRAQHAVLAVSCLILIVTGIPLKFHESAWSAALIRAMGGIEVSSLVHRIGAVGLIAVAFAHVLYITVIREGRYNFARLIPGPRDVKDAVLNIRYFLGLSKEKARFGRFSYIEKFDYWAVYWGCVIMIGSGAMLWWEEITLRWIPKWGLDVAHEAHSDEGLLASLAIIGWHFYNVHLRPGKFPMSRTFLTGRIGKEEMIEEHPLEYEELLERGELKILSAKREKGGE